MSQFVFDFFDLSVLETGGFKHLNKLLLNNYFSYIMNNCFIYFEVTLLDTYIFMIPFSF